MISIIRLASLEQTDDHHRLWRARLGILARPWFVGRGALDHRHCRGGRPRIEALQNEGRVVLERHFARPPALVTFETLSPMLPDTVWLKSLTLVEGRLLLTGSSIAASQLPSLLEGNSAFAAAFNVSNKRLIMPQKTGEAIEVDHFTLHANVRSEVGAPP